MNARVWVERDTNIDLKPRSLVIDLDSWSNPFMRTKIKSVIIKHNKKTYEADPDELIDALVASGLFKAVKE